jgi:hypothetical protein
MNKGSKNQRIQPVKMPNLTDALISKWILEGDVNQLKNNYKKIQASGKLNDPDSLIMTMLRMCRPDDDDNDPKNLRAFYGELLGQ